MREIQNRLATLYGESEARSIARLIMETRLGISMVDIFSGKDIKISPDKQQELDSILSRIEKGEPVQYAMGEAEFCGLSFKVNPSVLIPRPETEELVDWIVDKSHSAGALRILDIGTGSGCIAISLANQLKNAKIDAWDISDDALATASENAKEIRVTVNFMKRDALNPNSYMNEEYDIIVSNPPYIGEREKAEMQSNVLDHEPHLALFVPDGEELKFYKAILEGSKKALTRNGILFFEINSNFGEVMVNLTREAGFTNVELRQDFTGRDRMILASR